MQQKNTTEHHVTINGRVHYTFTDHSTGDKFHTIAYSHIEAYRKRNEWDAMGRPDLSVGGGVDELRERHRANKGLSDLGIDGEGGSVYDMNQNSI